MARMARFDLDAPDAPACPLLGLAADRQTRYTFAHTGHGCHAVRPPGVIAAYHQSRYCLGSVFVACEQYQAWQHEAGASPQPQSPNARVRHPAGPSRPDAPGPATAAAAPQVAAEPPTANVILVFRAGDTLTRIAAAYGVTVPQITAANGLASPDAATDGQRLVVPVGQRFTSPPGGIEPLRPPAPRSPRMPRADGAS